jgi:hypothetical protein
MEFEMRGCFFGLGTLLISTVAYADDTFWVIPEAQAQCILENRDQYLAQSGELILILVDQCPNVDMFAGAFDGQENFGGIGDVQTGTDLGSFDQMITYTPEQLKCLASEMILSDGNLARLPKFVSCEN